MSSNALTQVAQGCGGVTPNAFQNGGDVALRTWAAGTVGWVGIGLGDLSDLF